MSLSSARLHCYEQHGQNGNNASIFCMSPHVFTEMSGMTTMSKLPTPSGLPTSGMIAISNSLMWATFSSCLHCYEQHVHNVYNAFMVSMSPHVSSVMSGINTPSKTPFPSACRTAQPINISNALMGSPLSVWYRSYEQHERRWHRLRVFMSLHISSVMSGMTTTLTTPLLRTLHCNASERGFVNVAFMPLIIEEMWGTCGMTTKSKTLITVSSSECHSSNSYRVHASVCYVRVWSGFTRLYTLASNLPRAREVWN